MKIPVWIDREAAIRAGQDSYAMAEVEVDLSKLSPEQREVLARSYHYGTTHGDHVYRLTVAPPASEANLVVAIDGLLAREAQTKAEEAARLEAQVQELLAESQDAFNRDPLSWSPHQEAARDPRLADKMALRQAYRKEEQERQAQVQAERAARAARESQEAEAMAQAKRAQIAAWVQERGTPNQQSRFAAGLLADQEVLNAIEEEAFSPLAGEARYQRLTADDIEHDEEYERDVKFSSSRAESASDVEWDRITAIKDRIMPTHPEADVELREHTATCRNCDQVVVRRGVKATLTEGVFEFSREYAC